MHKQIQQRLRAAAERQRSLRFWREQAVSWGLAALLGLVFSAAELFGGSWLPFCLVAVAGIAGTIWVNLRQQAVIDLRGIALQIESHFPELDGRLITALEQKQKQGEWSYLQSRLNEEVAKHATRHTWGAAVPRRQVVLGQAMHWLALSVFLTVLWNLRTTGGTQLLTGLSSRAGVTVSPGDITLERGSSLVVLVRFNAKRLPSKVEMVSASAITGKTNRVPLAKTLGDPVFGVSVSEVQSDFTYHVEYGMEETKEFQVTVFEHPRLERADADLIFPDYTGQPPKRVENTRRLTVVEGTRASLKMTFNKVVATARLIAKDKQATGFVLAVATNEPTAELNDLTLQTNSAYSLELVDADGRTNKSPEQFVFEVAQNRTPEIRIASPRGDTRPSALEEITFTGTVWDDFGLQRFGLGYSLAGQDPVFIELGASTEGKTKRSFEHLLRLEVLGVKPDDFIAWFAWADDLSPDGEERRTTSDLFFAEVRPFDEVFREGQDGGGGGSGEAQQGGGGNGREPELAEIQKNILNATWNLRRAQSKSGMQEPAAGDKAVPATSPGRQSEFRSEAGRSRPVAAGLSHVGSSTPVQRFLAQAAPSREATPGAGGSRRTTRAAGVASRGNYQADLQTVREAQEEALAMAEEQLDRQQDPRTTTLLRAVVDAMKKSLSILEIAERSPERLPDALAAQQTAYQALLKLQEHEYQVQRNRRNQGQSGSSRQQQMQQQLNEMELTQSENRYETQRQAQAPKSAQQQETQQAFSRLQELARRQQDINEQLKELQSALQEAASEEQRSELRRRLKKLQEEEQELLSDLDETRQRMNRAENQSRMAEQQKRLEQTREQVQRAAEAAEQGSASQALAAGTRAQRELQELRDDLRKESSSQFSDEMRQARNQARELAKEQEELLKKMANEEAKGDRSLSGSPERNELLDRLARQRQRMTNLVDRATEVSQQAETAEPLLSRHLYDSLRKFSQDSAKNVQEAQSQLLNRGMMTRNLLDQLTTPGTPDGAKLMDITSEMLRQDFIPPARDAGQRSRSTLEDLKRGIEQAAESVLGDETEALRLAEQELKRLSDQLGQEMSLAQQGAGQTNGAAQGSSTNGPNNEQASQREPGAQAQGSETENQNGTRSQETASQGQGGQSQGPERQGENRGTGNRLAGGGDARRSASTAGGGGEGGDVRGGVGNFLDRFFDQGTVTQPSPLTGEDYAKWADQLRDVEEMIENPELRNDVATARERARRIRQDFKKDRQKPDWAVVRLQVMQPLAEVRKKLLEELAQRENLEPMAPIDRDPVPTQYSDLVRRYYESLGKDK